MTPDDLGLASPAVFEDASRVLARLKDAFVHFPALNLPVTRLTMEITKYCDVGCSFCKYSAAPQSGKLKRPDFYLGKASVQECIDFTLKHGVKHLLITGGGEPTHELETLFGILASASCQSFSIYTAGQWGTTEELSAQWLLDLNARLTDRSPTPDLLLRLSVDDFHEEKLSLAPIANIIRAYREHLNLLPSITLAIRTV